MVAMAKKIGLKTNYPGTLTLEVLEGAHRYNKWIAEVILPYVISPVLEVGAGIGNISGLFIHKTPVTLTDKDKAFTKYLRQKFSREVSVSLLDIENPLPGNLKNRFNTVISVNVLEHLKNDEEALRNMRQTLRRGGKLIILVPAKSKAYNKLDKELGHYRRYEKDEVILKLSEAGYSVNSVQFFNALGLLTWIVRNYLTGQNIHLTPRQIATFDLIVPLLKLLEKRVNIPIGISIVAIATNEK